MDRSICPTLSRPLPRDAAGARRYELHLRRGPAPGRAAPAADARCAAAPPVAWDQALGSTQHPRARGGVLRDARTGRLRAPKPEDEVARRRRVRGPRRRRHRDGRRRRGRLRPKLRRPRRVSLLRLRVQRDLRLRRGLLRAGRPEPRGLRHPSPRRPRLRRLPKSPARDRRGGPLRVVPGAERARPGVPRPRRFAAHRHTIVGAASSRIRRRATSRPSRGPASTPGGRRRPAARSIFWATRTPTRSLRPRRRRSRGRRCGSGP